MVGNEKQRKRDKAIEDYLLKFGCARASTLETLFFNSYRTTRHRLTKLTEYKAIQRHREHLNNEYIYYVTKPKQIDHRLILTDLHRELIKLEIEILKLENELTIFDGIRPDGFLVARHQGKDIIAFIECERQKPNVDKYESFYISDQWKVFGQCPQLIWVTNKTVPSIEGMKLKIIKEDLSNLHQIIH